MVGVVRLLPLVFRLRITEIEFGKIQSIQRQIENVWIVLTLPLRVLECDSSSWLTGRIFCCSRQMDRRMAGLLCGYARVFCKRNERLI